MKSTINLIAIQTTALAFRSNIAPRTYQKVCKQKLHSLPNMSRLASRIPKGTWDTHMHVVDPKKFPLDKSAAYVPSAHTVEQARSFLGGLGIERMVIVQPSIYGNDNACSLDGLRQLGPKLGRAVIQFDPATISKDQLREWHELGVRGVRINFKSVRTTPNQADLTATLNAYAEAIKGFNWVLELYIGLESVPQLERAAKELKGVKICVDHIGHPLAESIAGAKSTHDLPGLSSLLALLREGNTWVKLSATYRLHKDPANAIIESLIRELLRTRPDRLVFATDWPHTRFENVEVGAYLEKVLDWCEAEGVSLEQILVANARELFDASD